ncbi:unnamed protein product [Cyprideis torosa]|uniref:Uncharacterized protein n=1 Tax=Cyprideis torosa TaxID=163714 RepID=A0A7R8WDL3_9CRUS|nr:unnamed protein product [Cyprideis torosa]CAG0889174.1 unnamed protein product [Cyprideis torosa]
MTSSSETYKVFDPVRQQPYRMASVVEVMGCTRERTPRDNVVFCDTTTGDDTDTNDSSEEDALGAFSRITEVENCSNPSSSPVLRLCACFETSIATVEEEGEAHSTVVAEVRQEGGTETFSTTYSPYHTPYHSLGLPDFSDHHLVAIQGIPLICPALYMLEDQLRLTSTEEHVTPSRCSFDETSLKNLNAGSEAFTDNNGLQIQPPTKLRTQDLASKMAENLINGAVDVMCKFVQTHQQPDSGGGDTSEKRSTTVPNCMPATSTGTHNSSHHCIYRKLLAEVIKEESQTPP